jgi:hypothetical protein
VSAFDPGDPRNYRQVAGGTRPEQLRPGDRNAELPMIHELLCDVPEVAGDHVTVPACIHHDFQTFDVQGRGIELSIDAQVSGSVTFRRVAGGWRLHSYEWDWNRVWQRCGPEPAGTADVAWGSRRGPSSTVSATLSRRLVGRCVPARTLWRGATHLSLAGVDGCPFREQGVLGASGRPEQTHAHSRKARQGIGDCWVLRIRLAERDLSSGLDPEPGCLAEKRQSEVVGMAGRPLRQGVQCHR